MKGKVPFKELFISEDSQGIYSAIVYLTEKEAYEYGLKAHRFILASEANKAVVRRLERWCRKQSTLCSAKLYANDLLAELKKIKRTQED